MGWISQAKFDRCIEIAFEQGRQSATLDNGIDGLNKNLDELKKSVEAQSEKIKGQKEKTAKKNAENRRFDEIELDEDDVKFLFKCELDLKYKTLEIEGLYRWTIPKTDVFERLGISVSSQKECIDIIRNSKLVLYFYAFKGGQYIIFPDLNQKNLPRSSEYLGWYDLIQRIKSEPYEALATMTPAT